MVTTADLPLVWTPRVIEVLKARLSEQQIQQTNALMRRAIEVCFAPLGSKGNDSAERAKLIQQFGPIRIEFSQVFALLGNYQEITSAIDIALNELAREARTSLDRQGVSSREFLLLLQQVRQSSLAALRLFTEQAQVLLIASPDAPSVIDAIVREATAVDFGLTAIALMIEGEIPFDALLAVELIGDSRIAERRYEQATRDLMNRLERLRSGSIQEGLLAAGWIAPLAPAPPADAPSYVPVECSGEPLSESLVRERE